MPQVVPVIATFVANTTIAITGSAAAGIAAGNFVAGALSVGGLIKGAFLGGSILYSSSQARKAKKAQQAALNRGQKIMFRDTAAPRAYPYGTVPLSGPITFWHQHGTKGEYHNFIIPLSGCEINAINTVYFDETALTLDGSGNVTNTEWSGYARITKHLGTDTQTTDANFLSECSSEIDSNFRGRGCAYLAIQLKFDANIWPNGLPNIWALCEGRKILDSRTATTAFSANGGNVIADWLTFSRLGQRAEIADTELQATANLSDESVTLSDASTEARYTLNGVCYADVAPGEYLQQMVDGIAGFCGRIGGKWYIHGGAYRTPTVTLGPDDLRGHIGNLQTGLARTELFNAVRGLVLLQENDWQPTSFPAVRNGTYEWKVGRFSRDFTVNTGTDLLTLGSSAEYETGVGCRVTTTGTLPAGLAVDTTYYLIPGSSTTIKLASTRANAHAGTPIDITDTGSGTHTIRIGETHWRETEHNFVTSNGQAQRIAKIDIERTAQPISLVWPGKASCIRVKAGDVVLINYPDFGWSSKPFEVVEQHFTLTPVTDQDGLQVGHRPGEDLILRETATGVYTWANGEETAIDLSANTTLPGGAVADPTSLVSLSDATTTDQQPDGTTVPGIKLTWTSPADQRVVAGGYIRIEYKLSAASEWNHVDRIRGAETEAYIRAIVIGSTYDIRIRAETLVAHSDWVTTSETAAGDTVAPAQPTGLAATAGAGFISLDWDDNTEADLSEYFVYRHTSNSYGGASKIAEVKASRFIDAEVTPGTTYYYWIKAYDHSENDSTESDSTNAAATEPIDVTAPSTPSAPTHSSDGTYLAGDGTVFAYNVINLPALPSGAVGLNVLYRIDGGTKWQIVEQTDTGSTTARIDDLAPGTSYDFAVQAFSNGNTLSTISSTLTRTAPNKTGGPGAPSSLAATAGNDSGYSGAPIMIVGELAFTSQLTWEAPSDKDVAVYELAFTTTNSDSAANTASSGGDTYFVTDRTYIYANLSIVTVYWRIRSINRTGVSGSWASFGSLSSDLGLPSGNMVEQSSDAVEVTGITTGNGSSTPEILTRAAVNDSGTLTGGAASENVDIDLTNLGFSTKPDGPSGGAIVNSNNLLWRYDWDSASSTSTTARCVIYTRDGTNLAGSTAYRLQTEFYEI